MFVCWPLLIAYCSYHYAIHHPSSRLEWYFRRCSLYKTGSLHKWYFRRWYYAMLLTKGLYAVLWTYGNIYSRDYNIGLSNLVFLLPKTFPRGQKFCSWQQKNVGRFIPSLWQSSSYILHGGPAYSFF